MRSRILLLIFLTVSLVWAGETGKLVGTITDKTTGDPLMGVNVILQGTTFGAATDVRGGYYILNIPAAAYTVSASYIGYRTVIVTDVRINADLTTTLDIAMEMTAIEGEEVTVEAKRPVIVRDQTATTEVIEDENIVNMPVNSFEEIMTNMPGVVENNNNADDSGIHFRGGRTGEISYLVDGFLVENTLFGGMGMDVAKDAISELAIITGSFNAEYGKAMSGVVNIVTKEGTPNYTWELRSSTDQFGGLANNWLTNRIFGNLGGPIIPGLGNTANFHLSGDLYRSNTYLRKNQLPGSIYKPGEDGVLGTEDDTLAWADIDGDGAKEKLKKGAWETSGTFEKEGRLTAKVVFHPLRNAKITLGGNFFNREYRDFSMSYRQFPDRSPYNWRTTVHQYVKLNFSVTKNIYFSLKSQWYNRQGWTGYKPLLNEKHQLYSKLIPIPQDWEGYLPSTVTAGDTMNWLSYYAEPYKDLNGDGQWSAYAAEYWDDANGNGVWDVGESYHDWNEDSTWNMVDLDGDGLPDQEPFLDLDNNHTYSWGVDPRLREGDAYDNTSNYEFYGSYPVTNFYGDTIREGYSTYHDYLWYQSKYQEIGGELTWQLNEIHQLKTGFDKKMNDFSRFEGYAIGGGPFGNTSDPSFITYNFKPIEKSFFIQDKIEFKDIVVNMGLRYDELNPKSPYADPKRKLLYYYDGQSYTPDQINQIPTDDFNQVQWGYAAEDEFGNYLTNPDGSYQFEAAKMATVKSQWSPRLGIGYPVTDRMAFHFSYGHFFDYPELVNMYDYTNTNGASGVPPGLNIEGLNFGNGFYPFPFNTADWYIPEVGSPNIIPEHTVQYEFGLHLQLATDYVLNFTLYYKDIYDYIAAIIYDADPAQYAVYENIDYANAKGFELGIRKRFSRNLGWYFNYSLSRAEGSAPNESFHWDVAYLASVYGWHDYARTFTMSWDQTHTINFGLDYRNPRGYGANIIGTYGSGFPYTPTDARGRPIDEQYSGRMPSTIYVDLKTFYNLPIKVVNMRLYVDVFNLLNKRNVERVFGTTGKPDETLNPNTSPMWLWRPYFWSEPRHIELGISIGM